MPNLLLMIDSTSDAEGVSSGGVYDASKYNDMLTSGDRLFWYTVTFLSGTKHKHNKYLFTSWLYILIISKGEKQFDLQTNTQIIKICHGITDNDFFCVEKEGEHSSG